MTRLGILLTAPLLLLAAACTADTELATGAEEPTPAGPKIITPTPTATSTPTAGGASPAADAGSAVTPNPSPAPAQVPPVATCGPTYVVGGLVGPATAPTACRRAPVRSTAPDGWVRSLGTHTVGETVSFTVPANTQSVTVLSQGVQTIDSFNGMNTLFPNGVIPDQLIGPDSTVYWDDLATPPADGSQTFLMADGSSPTMGAVGMPNTTAMLTRSAAGVPPGTWRFKVNDWAYECTTQAGCNGGAATGTYDLQVVLKPGPAKSTGVIDLAFYLVSDNGITSANAAQNPRFQRMVSTLNTIYQRGGVCVGKVYLYDVPQWAKTKYATGIDATKSGPCDDLNQMFTLSQPGNTLNLFLVTSLTAAGTAPGTTLEGIDGTIPGPSTFGGGVHSGAAVSVANLLKGTCGAALDIINCGADLSGFIAAHEGGHWLGLFHTTESVGTIFDPVADSPTCACSQCAAQKNRCLGQPGVTSATAHSVDNVECSGATAGCGGTTNLMFWLLGQGSQGQLTPQQGQIMRSNPLVQ